MPHINYGRGETREVIVRREHVHTTTSHWRSIKNGSRRWFKKHEARSMRGLERMSINRSYRLLGTEELLPLEFLPPRAVDPWCLW